GSTAAEAHPLVRQRQATGTQRRRRKANMPAIVAALQAQLPFVGRLPVRSRVFVWTGERLFDCEHLATPTTNSTAQQQRAVADSWRSFVWGAAVAGDQ